jgi:hypothetical protein
MIFTVRANGGAPSGQAWPSSTTILSISKMMRMILVVTLIMNGFTA